MKTSIAVLAALGVIGTVGYLASSPVAGNNFAVTPMGEEEQEFLRFIAKHRRSYATREEYNVRLGHFAREYNNIKAQNMRGGATFEVNHMSDYSPEEYNHMLGFVGRDRPHSTELLDVSLPASVNWVSKGAVTPIKNQGQCGSCWAFSTTGSLEGCHFIKTGSLISLSEEQLVECSSWNNGCNGGNFDWAFQFTESNPLELESSYPYVAPNVQSCHQDASKEVFGATGFKDVAYGDNTALKASIVDGPTSVAIEADQTCFQSYKSGVLSASNCDCGTALDHAVLAVGYGSENGTPYILVKNSWGTVWGDNGYIKMADISGDGTCGINNQASRATC